MSVLKQRVRVREARLRLEMARHQLGEPVGALFARGREYPLTTVGVAAGTGFALGSLNVHPLRIPGLASLVGGGVAEAVTHGARLLAELAALGVTGNAADESSGAGANDVAPS